ncbi:MAG: Methyltransferase type 11 [Gemmatimonadetes bacterium]|nr:Methyltransferase type 11 [Gemmatimonadota bacterium]
MERQAAALPKGARVLDVGAGAGPYRKLLAHCDYKAHDFGQEPATVGHYTPLDYESDILAIPAPDGSFDAILCTEVLEHVPDPVGAVREMARLLAPGGRLLLSAPLGSLLHQEPYHFYGGFTPYWYRKFLEEAGFETPAIERNAGFFRWFAQEALRFAQYLDPRRTGSLRMGDRMKATCLWLVSAPFCYVMFPLAGRWLDTLGLESIGTAGYHVVALRAR